MPQLPHEGVLHQAEVLGIRFFAAEVCTLRRDGGTSWWSALALTPAPFIPIFGLWLSLTYKSWWPISVAVSATIALYYVVTRYVPLGRISRLEVAAFRIGGALLAAFFTGSVILALAG